VVVEAHARVTAELAVLERLRARLDGLAAEGGYVWSAHDRSVFSELVTEAGSLQDGFAEYLHGTAGPDTAPDPRSIHRRVTGWLERSAATRRDVHGYLRRTRRDRGDGATVADA
jgi:hypothetical protein